MKIVVIQLKDAMKRFLEMPVALKITMLYLLISTLYSIYILITNIASIPSVADQNIAATAHDYGYIVGIFLGEILVTSLSLIIAYGIFRKRKWTLVFMIITFIYSIFREGPAFARGFANGAHWPLNTRTIIVAYGIHVLWYLFWLFLMTRKASRNYFKTAATEAR